MHQEDKKIQKENKTKSLKFKKFCTLLCEKFFPEESEREDISYFNISFDFFLICLSQELQLTKKTYSLVQSFLNFVNVEEGEDEAMEQMNWNEHFAMLRTMKKLYTSYILKDYEEEYSNLEAEVEALKQLLDFHRSLFLYNKKKNLDLKATKAVEKEQDDPMDGLRKIKTEVKNFSPDYCRREIYLTIWNFLLKDKIRDLIYYYSKIYDPVYENEYKNIVRKNLLWNLMSSYDLYQNYNDEEFYNNIRFIYKKFVVPLIMEILDFEKEKYYNTNPSEEEKKEKKRFYDNLLPTLEDSSSDSEEDFYLDNSLRRKALEEKFSDLVKNKKEDYFYKKEVDPCSQEQKNLKAEENQNIMNFFHKNYKEEAKEEKSEFSTEDKRVLENLNVDDYLFKKKSLFEHGISKGNLKKK